MRWLKRLVGTSSSGHRSQGRADRSWRLAIDLRLANDNLFWGAIRYEVRTEALPTTAVAPPRSRAVDRATRRAGPTGGASAGLARPRSARRQTCCSADGTTSRNRFMEEVAARHLCSLRGRTRPSCSGPRARGVARRGLRLGAKAMSHVTRQGPTPVACTPSKSCARCERSAVSSPRSRCRLASAWSRSSTPSLAVSVCATRRMQPRRFQLCRALPTTPWQPEHENHARGHRSCRNW